MLPRAVVAARVGRVVLERNASGYDSRDVAAFVDAGLAAAGIRHTVSLVVTSSPIFSRGCAVVGGDRMVLAIAAPSRFSIRRLARLVDHEARHIKGDDHGAMSERDLYSLGPTPAWARDLRIRYRGRASRQL